MSSWWFWLPVLTGNVVLLAIVVVWYFWGWAWAVAFSVVGPLAMLAGMLLVLVGFFLFDAHTPPCLACGHPAPLQMRGRRYRRRYCESCERQRGGS